MPTLTAVNPQTILDRLRSGESLRTIAADLNISQVGLRAWLLREDSEQYHDVITTALTHRVAEADEMLEAAQDSINIARAREIARFARMDLERRRPNLYGQRQQLTVDVGPDLGDMLRAARARVCNPSVTPAIVNTIQDVDSTTENGSKPTDS